jgi:hypothetical protein
VLDAPGGHSRLRAGRHELYSETHRGKPTTTPALDFEVSDASLEQDPNDPQHYWLQLPLGLQVVTITTRAPAGTSVTIDGIAVAPNARWKSPQLHPGDNAFEVVWERAGSVATRYLLSARSAWRTTHLLPSKAEADQFGSSVALSRDGATLIIGAPGEQDDSAYTDDWGSGAAYELRQSRAKWEELARLRAPESLRHGGLGNIVALAADGKTSAFSATSFDDSDNWEGNLFLFDARAGSWIVSETMHTGADPEVEPLNLALVRSLALSGDGRVLIAGAPQLSASGEVYAFARDQTGLHQEALLKAADYGNAPGRVASADDQFGATVAISDDGTVLAVGAGWESRPVVNAVRNRANSPAAIRGRGVRLSSSSKPTRNLRARDLLRTRSS